MKIRWPIGIALMGAASCASAQWGETGPTLIFFDWGKNELSGDAKASLDKVSETYRQTPRALTVDGHSDRSGGSASNLVSSRQRARIVRDYLLARGVPIGAMTIRAYGEDRPIVATEDGVREVQNRRVEIRWAG